MQDINHINFEASQLQSTIDEQAQTIAQLTLENKTLSKLAQSLQRAKTAQALELAELRLEVKTLRTIAYETETHVENARAQERIIAARLLADVQREHDAEIADIYRKRRQRSAIRFGIALGCVIVVAALAVVYINLYVL